jgi:hypothetical protein
MLEQDDHGHAFAACNGYLQSADHCMRDWSVVAIEMTAHCRKALVVSMA